jgi:D-3-phosphoglycerate dehydrogenase
VVGALGTVLGESGINISRMHIGSAEDGPHAVAAIEMSTPLSDAQMAKIRSIPAVSKAFQITL